MVRGPGADHGFGLGPGGNVGMVPKFVLNFGFKVPCPVFYFCFCISDKAFSQWTYMSLSACKKISMNIVCVYAGIISREKGKLCSREMVGKLCFHPICFILIFLFTQFQLEKPKFSKLEFKPLLCQSVHMVLFCRKRKWVDVFFISIFP